MNLQDFIRESIVQIIKAMQEANNELEGADAMVNPRYVARYNNDEGVYGELMEPSQGHDVSKNRRAVHSIGFDVAVHATEETSKTGGAALHVGMLIAGGRNTGAQSSASESRIRFAIPVVYPTANVVMPRDL